MSISLETVRAIARLLPEADLSEITIESVDFDVNGASLHLSLKRAAVAPKTRVAPAPVAAEPSPEIVATEENRGVDVTISSSTVGVFRPSRTPLQVGDEIKVGQVVCAVESLKVPSEVKAEGGGHVRSILVEDGQGVEYGQALFVIEPNAFD